MTQEFIDNMIERFKAGKTIHRKYAFQIIKAAKDLVYAEPTMVEIGVDQGTHLTVCGDTHGMFSTSFSPVVVVVVASILTQDKVNSSIFSRFSG